MTNWIARNKRSIIRAAFLVPILAVAAISISHVVSWYDLANPISWAIYLSIAVEIAAMSAIAASSVKVKGFSVWFVFLIVTLIQFIGNIFFSYTEINVSSKEFKDWAELTLPVFEAMGSDTSDLVSQRRFLALLEGGLLPLISLTCLHFFIKYGDLDKEEPILEEDKTEPEEEKPVTEADKIWAKVKELREEGKLPPEPTAEDLADEPTALAFTPYEIEEQVDSQSEANFDNLMDLQELGTAQQPTPIVEPEPVAKPIPTRPQHELSNKVRRLRDRNK